MRNAIPSAALMVQLIVCSAFALQRKTENTAVATDTKVFIGQSLDDAKKAVSSKKIEFHEGGFAFAKGDPDESNLIVIIDKSHAWACVWYSKSKLEVTRLAMVFRPSRQAVKPEQSWLPATELVVHEDRSYSVKFKPPLADEEIKKREENRPSPPELPTKGQ